MISGSKSLYIALVIGLMQAVYSGKLDLCIIYINDVSSKAGSV
jgi:hypothetical protein